MREPLLQESVSEIGRLLFLQSFEYLERECGVAMGRPGVLQDAVDVAARPQREPDPVLDLVEVERLPPPDFARDSAAQGVNPGDARALLVVGDRELSRFGFHSAPP